MRILVTPTFERAVKKLHKQQKAALDEAVRTTPKPQNPNIFGEGSEIIINKNSYYVTVLILNIKVDDQTLMTIGAGCCCIII